MDELNKEYIHNIVTAMRNAPVKRTLMTYDELWELFEGIKKTPIELEKGCKENED